MDDEQLISGLLRGTPAAAEALIDRFGQPLMRYFAVHSPDSSQAEDMVQEVFLRLLGTLRRTTGHDKSKEVRSLYSLVFTIARHLAIDVRKTTARRPKLWSLDESPDVEGSGATGPIMVHMADSSPDPRQRAAVEQRQQRIDQAVRELAPEHRDVLILRHVEDLNGRQIAEVLGVREGTVWSRLSRAIKELRIKLAELHDAEAFPQDRLSPAQQRFPKGGAK